MPHACVSRLQESVLCQQWPQVNEAALAVTEVDVAVQVQGKKRGVISIDPALLEKADALLEFVLRQDFASKWIGDRERFVA